MFRFAAIGAALSLLLVGLFTSVVAAQDAGPQVADDSQRSTDTNHLAGETSPYLLQHATNPVDWYPWGPAALAKAKEEDKLIFLSVGYSTCHWCHVMERESFEEPEIARFLKEHYVCIKVDREERPDVDEQFMLATQLVAGRGGWPNSVWLTPEGLPWMAGTYFPPEQFQKLIERLEQLWTNDRQRIEQQAARLAEAIREVEQGTIQATDRDVDRSLVDRAVAALAETYDDRHGGYGADQKFPPHESLRLLVEEYRRQADDQSLAQIVGTLDAMASGGIRDHLAGGFHRYATDRRWFLPHFEKMLYDNAQLLRLYTDGYRLTGNRQYRQVAEEIVNWIQQDMTHPEGAFYSALDSQSDGEEGSYYVWSLDEVQQLLGDDDAELFADAYGMQADGNWADEATGEPASTNVLYLPRPLSTLAEDRQTALDDLETQLAAAREKLRAARQQRPAPRLDDKIVCGWNGLMISALAYAGQHLDQPKYTAAAERAARFLLDEMVDDRGRLHRTYRQGQAKQPGYLNDYAFLAEGLLELHAATGEQRWLDEAERLADILLRDFEDPDDHAFFFTTDDHDELLLRSKNLHSGGNLPTGNAAAIRVMSQLGELTGEAKYTDAAVRTSRATVEFMDRAPLAAVSLVAATADMLDRTPPVDQVAGSRHGAQPDAEHRENPVAIEVYASRQKVKPSGRLRLAVRIAIDDGWHLYGENPDHALPLKPTQVAVAKQAAVESAKTVTPPAKEVEDPVLGERVHVYEGETWFLVEVGLAEALSAESFVLPVDVSYQACDDRRCLAPKTVRLEIAIDVDDSADAGERHPAIFERFN